MASNASLILPSVKLPASSTLASLNASTNLALLSMNTQMQQIGSAFTLTKPTVTTDGSYGGVTVGNITMGSTNYIKGGALGYNSGTGFWLGYDSSPTAGYKFFVGSSTGNKMTWNGSVLSITGSITATTGSIGGWTIGSTTLSAGSGNITLDSAQNSVRAGQTDYETGTGFWLGNTSGTPKFSIGSTTNYFKWNGTNVEMLGGSGFNNVIINTAGFTVGASGGRRVAVGTYSGNPASMNFYDAVTPTVSKLGIYLGSGITPTIDFANSGTTGNTASISLSTSVNTFSISCQSTNSSYGGATYPSTLNFDTGFGSPLIGAGGPSGLLGYGPYISFTNTQTGDILQLRATGGLKSCDGTQANPSISFNNSLSTGFFLPAANTVRLSCGGSLVADFQASQITLSVPLRINNAYVNIASGIIGYVTIQDSSGTTRKLAVMA